MLSTAFRTTYGLNGRQWLGKSIARTIGERNYEMFRLEKRIIYARYWYRKQYHLTWMSQQMPELVNAFGVLAKEDTSHGFPVWRPLERNSDWSAYNVNSEGWFQAWSAIFGCTMVLFWNYVSNWFFVVSPSSYDEEDMMRYRDAKPSQMWERNFWSFTYQIHGYHAAALYR